MALNVAPFSLAGRPTVLLAPYEFSVFGAKTAVCYLRYRLVDVIAVVDPMSAGKTVEDIVGFGGTVPVLRDVDSAVSLGAEVAVVGIAPRGGQLSGELRPVVERCVELGLDVVSGLHDFLGRDPSIARAASRSGSRIWDVREVSAGGVVGTGRGCQSGAYSVLVVGTDCNVGKMTATVELFQTAVARGLNAAWAATGQTGIMLRGRGVAVDRVISDFVAGAVEELVNFEGEGRDLLFIEGQGSLVHPGFAAVTLGLMFGAMPDCMVLVHAPSRETIGDSKFEMPGVQDLVNLYETVMAPLKETPVVAIALNTAGFDDTTARVTIERIAAETGRATTDPVRFGAGVILDAIARNAEGHN